MFAVTSPWLCWTLLSVSLVGFTCAGSFVVNVTQTSCQAEENHNITLEWTFTVETGRSPTYLIIYCELIKPQRISVLYHVRDGAEVSESQGEKFSGRVQSDEDALREGRIRLQLCRLRTEDSGRYRCEVNTDYGFSSASCRLNVTDPDEVIDAKQGEDITLECWEFTDAPIELLEWSRPELKPDYVFYYREQRSYEIFQHSSYKGRVKLRDPEMKNGDVSVILKEVTFNDAGRYECLVGTRRTRDKRSSISVRVEQTTKDTSGGGNTERENRDVGGNMEREKWRVGKIAAIVITVTVATTLILLIGVVVAKVGQQVRY